MKKVNPILAGILLIICMSCQMGNKHKFTYASHEAKGFSTEKLDVLKEHLEKSGSSSMMLTVDGEIIFEWGDVTRKHTIHSIRKAILNSLYGTAVAAGEIDTSMNMSELDIDDIEPGLSDGEKKARIADLLKSRSGIFHNAAAVSEGMLQGMPARGSYAPGEHFYYNNWDFNVLGTILEQQTGSTVYKLFKKRIADPLGMLDYRGRYSSIDGEEEGVEVPNTDGFYQYENSKSDFPAYHFRLSARDMALFGQLYVNGGLWNGEQIIPSEWIEVSTQPYSEYLPEWGVSYGMLWYVNVWDEVVGGESYFHTGAGIHMLGVYPGLNLVIVHRVDTEKESSYEQNDFYLMLDLLFGAMM